MADPDALSQRLINQRVDAKLLGLAGHLERVYGKDGPNHSTVLAWDPERKHPDQVGEPVGPWSNVRVDSDPAMTRLAREIRRYVNQPEEETSGA